MNDRAKQHRARRWELQFEQWKSVGVRGILNPNIVAPRQVDCKESAGPLAGIDFGYSKQIAKFFARHFGRISSPHRYTARAAWRFR